MLRRHWGKMLGGVALAAIAAWIVVRQVRGPELAATAVERADAVQTVLVSGRVLPPAEVELAARAEAPVLEVLADEGDAVEAGQILARLEATAAEAEVARARATLARTQAASGRSRRIAPGVAQQSLSTAQSQLSEAERAFEQAQRLVSTGAWPRDRLDAARDALSRARSAERGAELELSAARGADRRAATAAVGEALANLSLAEERLTQTTISAPVAGVILERRVEQGDTARPGAVLFVMAADGPPILSVDPDERHLSQLAIDQPARVLCDAYADHPFDARVSFIAPSVDPERGTVEVRLLPTETIDFLRPNMTVSVEIEVARADDALVLPASLVQDAATDAPWVWVVEGGRLARRPVTLGLRGDEQLQVTDGLREGERAVVVIDASLEAGSPARAAP
ncbi:MAG: efflux RND transporter periplasmic adaptor subunit [Sandaracinaceae bacterium]